jgi:hypothetical protein
MVTSLGRCEGCFANAAGKAPCRRAHRLRRPVTAAARAPAGTRPTDSPAPGSAPQGAPGRGRRRHHRAEPMGLVNPPRIPRVPQKISREPAATMRGDAGASRAPLGHARTVPTPLRDRPTSTFQPGASPSSVTRHVRAAGSTRPTGSPAPGSAPPGAPGHAPAQPAGRQSHGIRATRSAPAPDRGRARTPAGNTTTKAGACPWHD